MAPLAIIGGSGITQLPGLSIIGEDRVTTPFGDPAAPLIRGLISGTEIVFLPRHGTDHSIPPHRINYRANLWALHETGAKDILAFAAVGGVHPDMGPGTLVVPDQIIDYTHDRRHTYFEGAMGLDARGRGTDPSAVQGIGAAVGGLSAVVHVDFTRPYCERMRQAVLDAGRGADEAILDRGTYGATQGPRLETAAEITRMERDGCDLVGMTGMPEASLARELDLCYCCCAFVVNWAAGKSDGPILMREIEDNLTVAATRFRRILQRLIEVRKVVSIPV